MFQMTGNMISDGFRRICCRWFTKEVSLSGTNNGWLVSSCLVEVSDKFSRNSDAHRCVWPKQGKKHSGRSGMHKHLPRRLRKTGNGNRQNSAKLFPWSGVRLFEEEKQLLLDAGSLERHCTIMTGMALVVSPAILCLKVQRPPVTSFHALGLQINEHVLRKHRSALKASAWLFSIDR